MNLELIRATMKKAQTDEGMEFEGDFARRVEQLGILHHTTNAESPWQNGRAERAAGKAKGGRQGAEYMRQVDLFQTIHLHFNKHGFAVKIFSSVLF